MKAVSTLFVCGWLLLQFPIVVGAHHSRAELAVRSAKCGWIEAEDLRDRRNLADFCAEWVPAAFRIQSVTATKERLWVEAPRDLVATLRSDTRATAALLQAWLERWRKITGYKTASVSLLRSHIEFARVNTTMTGDVVTIR